MAPESAIDGKPYLLGTGPDPWDSTADPSEPGECSELLKPAELLPLPELFEVWLREQQTPKPATQEVTSEIVHTTPTGTPSNLRDRVYRYLDVCDPAIQGQKGSGTTFRVLSNTYHGFNLTEPQLRDAAKYYNQKCNPPWSDGELDHKVHDVIEKSTPPNGKVRGELLTEVKGYGTDVVNGVDMSGLMEKIRNMPTNATNPTIESQDTTDDSDFQKFCEEAAEEVERMIAESQAMTDATVPPAETTTTTDSTQWGADLAQAKEKGRIQTVSITAEGVDIAEDDCSDIPNADKFPITEESRQFLLQNVPAIADDPYPVDAFPGLVGDFIDHVSKSLDRDPQMVGTFLLPALAAMTGNSREAAVSDEWSEPNILWACVIAPPSEKKTPVMNQIERTIRPGDDRERKAYNQAMDEYQIKIKRYGEEEKQYVKGQVGELPNKPKLPTDKRIIITDVTREAVIKALANAPRGLFIPVPDPFATLRTLPYGRRSFASPPWLHFHRKRVYCGEMNSPDGSNRSINTAPKAILIVPSGVSVTMAVVTKPAEWGVVMITSPGVVSLSQAVCNRKHTCEPSVAKRP